MYQLIFKKSKSMPLTSTISDVIYQDMKESIIRRKLRPNQRIRIREIARFLGVSQSPVRDAIQRLAAEKFVTIAARSEVRLWMWVSKKAARSSNLSGFSIRAV